MRSSDLVDYANSILMSLASTVLRPRSDATFAHESLQNVSFHLAGNPLSAADVRELLIACKRYYDCGLLEWTKSSTWQA